MNHADILRNATGKNLLYKYVPPHTDFLQTELYRFTQPNKLNDPFEARPRVLMNKYAPEDYEEARAKAAEDGFSNFSHEELEDFFMRSWPHGRYNEKSFPGLWPAHLPELRDEPFLSIEELDYFRATSASIEFIDNVSMTMGIFCLTREPHSLLMWAHYADDHKGMLLAFDQDHAFFNRGSGLHSVEYLEERVSITSKDGLQRFCGIRFEDSIPMLLRAFMRKHPVWSYEDEIRIILPLYDCDKRHPDKPEVYLFRIPAEALRAIVLGARISKTVAKFIRILLVKDHRWKHVRLFKAELNNYGMTLDYIEDSEKAVIR